MVEVSRSHQTTIKRTIPVALLLAFLLHNLEEALTFRTYRGAGEALVRNLISQDIVLPSTDSFLIALTAVSLAATLAMGWSFSQPSRPSASLLVKALAWIMLLNVFVPHVPAAVMLGGYAPGAATAILINLPLSFYVLNRLGFSG